jgi:hypothetical protein
MKISNTTRQRKYGTNERENKDNMVNQIERKGNIKMHGNKMERRKQR